MPQNFKIGVLGYNSNRFLRVKQKYSSLISTKPNQIWCADVTIVKTLVGVKHYIHFLIDHFSRKILGCIVENSSKPAAIKQLLQEAYLKYKPDDPIQFLTDGSVENVNLTVKQFLETTNNGIIHLIAQKDILFSNSRIEAVNKTMKHQYLLARNLENGTQLRIALPIDILSFNSERPQLALMGNTPDETFEGKPLDFSQHKTHFAEQKTARVAQNQQNRCKTCKK
jgi:putative transposase